MAAATTDKRLLSFSANRASPPESDIDPCRQGKADTTLAGAEALASADETRSDSIESARENSGWTGSGPTLSRSNRANGSKCQESSSARSVVDLTARRPLFSRDARALGDWEF